MPAPAPESEPAMVSALRMDFIAGIVAKPGTCCEDIYFDCEDSSILLKNSFGVLRQAQDDGERVELIKKIPFMLRLSKHSVSFFSDLLGGEAALNLAQDISPIA
jgi:hypothetical protein